MSAVDRPPTTLLVVDDHPVVRSGLTAMLESDPRLRVRAATDSVAATLAVVPELAEDPPDVCVVDLQLPDGDGVDLGSALKEAWPHTRVLLLTMSTDPTAVLRSVAAGLDGHLLKDADPDELVAAVHAVARGSVVIGRSASAPFVTVAGTSSGTPAPGALLGALDALDTRDREILGLLAAGLTSEQVARRLFLAPKTIRNRTTDIVAKLGLGSRDEAIRAARSAGLHTG